MHKLSRALVLSWALLLCLSAPRPGEAADQPERLAIAGLVHGHVDGFLRALKDRTDVELVGVFDPDVALHEKYADTLGLARSLFYTDLAAMLDRTRPQAVATFTSTYDHPMVVEACAARHIHVMMEKPLAVGVEPAARVQRAADRGGICVVVNYETTWYPSHGALWDIVKTRHSAGDIRRMVALDGHSGPKEIGVGPEFLGWLTNPERNGAGALFDFGCYGANLMTWLMDNARPQAVTAVLQRLKPEIYPRVDDEATVLVEYPKAVGIIQASWNWPFSRKDLEVYGERGYARAIGPDVLRLRLPDRREEEVRPLAALPADERDSLSYLTAIVRGRREPSGLSSLQNNLIVTEILEAARESARSGRTVRLR
jgi:predicted dehydrogenase